MNNLSTLEYKTNLILVDIFSGKIIVNSIRQEEIYYIKVECTLSDLISKDYIIFKIILTSKEPSLPTFKAQPLILDMIEIMAGTLKDTFYSLPIDSGCKECYVSHNPPLPLFIKFEYPKYNFKVVEKKYCCKLH